ncbi:MAG: hypothetical protein HY744_27365, partial [Deltaproteobacteria bacterium]|nr:hypothetical protein [Deltaproteobacteria bacterium]
MKEPQRLIDGAGDELEIALLASAAEDDGPSAAAMGRMLVALGIGGGLGVAGAAAAAPTASGAAAAAAGKGAAAAAAGKGAVLAAAGQGTVAVLAKWAVIAAVGGIGTWGIVEHLIASDGPPSGPSAAVLAPGTAPMRAPGTGLAVQVPRSGA